MLEQEKMKTSVAMFSIKKKQNSCLAFINFKKLRCMRFSHHSLQGQEQVHQEGSSSLQWHRSPIAT